MDLAEVDLLPLLVVVGGTEDDEVGVVVVLDLRSLVWALRVLDRELVKIEELLEPLHVTRLGLVQADPDELAGARAARDLGGLLGRQRPSCWRAPSL